MLHRSSQAKFRKRWIHGAESSDIYFRVPDCNMTQPPWIEFRERVKQGLVSADELESAIAAADSKGDWEASLELRVTIAGLLNRQNHCAEAITRFQACFPYSDKLSENRMRTLLWRYRILVSGVTDCPSVPRKDVEAALEDMESRYERHGFSTRSVWVLRLLLGYRGWWDEDVTSLAMQKYRELPRDTIGDRQQTEATFSSLAVLRFGPKEAALNVCRMKIDIGIHRCDLKAAVLRPLLDLGERELATEQHQEGLPLAQADPGSFSARSFHALYLSRLGHVQLARELIIDDFLKANSSLRMSDKLEYFTHAAWILEQGNSSEPIPREIGDTSEVKVDTHGELAGWCRDEALKIARLYDQHNRAARATRFVVDSLAIKPI